MLLEGLKKLGIFAIVLLQIATGTAEESATDTILNIRPGRYVPELHGGDRGRYMADDSGKYNHVFIPYDGGYGDRGVKYDHDEPKTRPPDVRLLKPKAFELGPKDHLRFMIDFNYNDSGWQILQFEWQRDGDEIRHYNYINENRLWDDNSSGADEASEPIVSDQADKDNNSVNGYVYERNKDVKFEDFRNEKANSESTKTQNTNASAFTDEAMMIKSVSVSGDYNENSYNVSNIKQNVQTESDPRDVQRAIKEILEFVQMEILPTLS